VDTSKDQKVWEDDEMIREVAASLVAERRETREQKLRIRKRRSGCCQLLAIVPSSFFHSQH
jgi:hypothetical protein